jgi:hypothetical protein
MIECASCGWQSKESTVFCPKCGRRLTDTRITCPKCGAKNPKERTNCWKCQVDLNQAYLEIQQAILIPEKKRPFVSMRTWVVLGNVILACFVILGIFFAINNPNRQTHLGTISDNYTLVTKLAQEDSIDSAQRLTLQAIDVQDVHLAQWFNELTAQERRAYFNQFRHYNLLLFSLTAYKGQLQTLGYCNHVWHRFDVDQTLYNMVNSRAEIE